MNGQLMYFLDMDARERGCQFISPRDGDAGYDLYANVEHCERVWTNYSVTVPTGLHLEIPDGYVGLIKDRSSIGSKGLHVFAGVIDSHYRGDVRITLFNHGDSFIIKPGMKIAQMIIIPHLSLDTVGVQSMSDLSATARGDQGYGSTGE